MSFRRFPIVGLLACLLGVAGWSAVAQSTDWNGERRRQERRQHITSPMMQNLQSPSYPGISPVPFARQNLRLLGQAQVEPDLIDDPVPINPEKFPLGSRVLADQSYGRHPLQKLDVYSPASPRNAPLIVMVHGGAWLQGDKAMAGVVQNKAIYWLQQGYIFVSVNYQIYGANPVIQSVDIMQAMAWIQKYAPLWGGDPNKIILMGHSSGAHLASLAAVDADRLTKLGIRPWRGTVLLDSPVFDTVQAMTGKHYPYYDMVFGDNSNLWAAASPLEQARKGTRPMLLVCSSKRKESCPQAENFAKKIMSLGGDVSINSIALTTKELNDQLGLPGSYTDAVAKAVEKMLATPFAEDGAPPPERQKAQIPAAEPAGTSSPRGIPAYGEQIAPE